MSTAQLEALRSKAMALTEPERARLARDLVASLDGPADDTVAKAWDVELCRRINEIEKNSDLAIDANDVLTRARARIGDK